MKKRFWVFSYCEYYPGGGKGDFKADFDTLEEAYAYHQQYHSDYMEILDMQERVWWEVTGHPWAGRDWQLKFVG